MAAAIAHEPADLVLRSELAELTAQFGIDEVLRAAYDIYFAALPPLQRREPMKVIHPRTRPLVPNAENRSDDELRAFLTADLSNFPASFQRVLHLESWTDDQVVSLCDQLDANERRRQRERDYPPRRWPAPAYAGCGCGCEGESGRLYYYVKPLRDALRLVQDMQHQVRQLRAREPRTAAGRQRNLDRIQALTGAIAGARQRVVADRKKDLVLWLWISGQRKIDRRALTQHVLEEAKLQIESHERRITKLEHEIHLRHARLERGVYRHGAKRGQPLSLGYRETITEEIGKFSGLIDQSRARIAELDELLAFDVPRLVRQFTGCARAAEGA